MQVSNQLNPHIGHWVLNMLVSGGGMMRLAYLSEPEVILAAVLGGDAEDWIDIEPSSVRRKLRTEWCKRRGSRPAALPLQLCQNVKRLNEITGLSEVECRLLELAVCLQSEPVLAQASETLGALNNRQAVELLGNLLSLPAQQVELALSRKATLFRSGLLHWQDGRIELACKLEPLSWHTAEVIFHGDATVDELLHDLVKVTPAAELVLADYKEQAKYLEILIPYLKHALKTSASGVNILLHGAPGTGKTQLARLLAGVCRCQMYEVLSEDSNGEQIRAVQRLAAYRGAQHFFSSRKTMLLFDEVEDIFSGNDGNQRTGTKAWINQLLEENNIPAIWIGNSVEDVDPAFIRRFDVVVEMVLPNEEQRLNLLKKYSPPGVSENLLKRLAQQPNLSPAVIQRAAKVAAVVEPSKQGFDASMELLMSSTLAAQGHELAELKEKRPDNPYNPAFIQADVELAQSIPMLKQNPEARICLYGPPGTGKTAFGRWLAQQLDMPLLIKRASDLLGAFVGENEQNIAAAFKEASQTGSILMVDEVDSFLSERAGAHRNWEVSMVNEMLTQMETFDGIFIASTNRMDGLDQAVLRRFDIKAGFDYLNQEQVWSMLASSCRKLGLRRTAQMRSRVSSLQWLTPGDFVTVERQARFNPLASGAGLLAALEREMGFKEVAKKRRIGF